MRKLAFCICESKGAKGLYFHYIVQSLYHIHPKYQASRHLLQYNPVCVVPGWEILVFS